MKKYKYYIVYEWINDYQRGTSGTSVSMEIPLTKEKSIQELTEFLENLQQSKTECKTTVVITNWKELDSNE